MILDKNEILSIVQQLKEELLPIGCILIYPSENVPLRFLPCDGSELSKKAYPELYALIKGTWGETKDSFFLPDLQGQFIRGWDKDGDVDSERKLGSLQEDSLQGHGHKVSIVEKIQSDSSGSHRHKVYYKSHDVSSGVFSSYPVYEVSFSTNNETLSSDGSGTTYEGSHCHDIKIPNGFLQIEDPESSIFGTIRIAVETRPTNVALMFCIKVK